MDSLRVGLFSYYAVMSITRWEEETICLQRINVVLTIIFAIGVGRGISLLRYLLNELPLDFEVTVIMIIVFLLNKFQVESCSNNLNSNFESFSLYFFNFVLLCNSIFYFILLLLFTISFFVYHYLSPHIPLPPNLQRNLSNDVSQNEIPEAVFEKMVIDLDDTFKEDDCGICLFKLGEKIPDLEENNSRIIKENHSQLQGVSYESLKIDSSRKEDRIICLPVCLHKFHYQCVKLWLKTRTTCPLDRTFVDLTQIQLQQQQQQQLQDHLHSN